MLMNILRCKFTKENDMKYISHLDIIRLFEKMLRMSKIKLSFSQGYNPRPKIAFAQALSLGVESFGEYVDIELEEKLAVEDFLSRVNEVSPLGIRFLKAEYVDQSVDSLMSSITHGSYLLYLKLAKDYDLEKVQYEIKKFLDVEEIIELKENKKGKINEINIRPFIKEFEVVSLNERDLIINAVLSTGSAGNLKPFVLIEKLNKSLLFEMDKVKVLRKDLFMLKNNSLCTPI